MSGEDDTFDIDIYGDEGKDNQQGQQNDDEDNLVFDDDEQYGYDGQQDGSHEQNGAHQEQSESSHQAQNGSDSTATQQQGTKRKAEDDGYEGDSYHGNQDTSSNSNFNFQTDPRATPALKMTELHWWTTEEDLRAFCSAANAESHLRDLSFGEHKINGKSRGEAYLEFDSAAAADAVKREMEKTETKNPNEEPKRVNPFVIFFTAVGNPFRGRDSGAQGKKDFSAGGGRGGAYNPNFSGGRGGFNRGGGFNNRGGGGFNRGGFQQQQGGWNNNMGGGYGAPNPMMNNPMMMGMGAMGMGFNNMGRGGGMMGRGGMNPMAGMNMGMGGGGRGGMMGGRGGWGGGGGNFQQGGMGYGGGGGYGMGMQGGPNKRMKEG